MHPGRILICPQGTGNAVHGIKDLMGLPRLMIQEFPQIVGGLMQVENQSVVDGLHIKQINELNPGEKCHEGDILRF